MLTVIGDVKPVCTVKMLLAALRYVQAALYYFILQPRSFLTWLIEAYIGPIPW